VAARLTALAESQVRAALAWATADSVRAVGSPEDGVGIAVLGLGKLGGQEMGFGSDLDLVFVYGRDGTTRGAARPASHGDLFTRIAQRTMHVLSQPDASGPGYETDTRLRPSGSHGTLVVSFDAFERYHETNAEAWEGQVLLRARGVAGDPELGARLERACERFAYERGGPDAESVARMRARIQRELAHERASRAPGVGSRLHPKLGYGGLVDVEFVVQWLQMQHGHRDASVRRRDTLGALAALEAGGYVSADDATTLREGWIFSRSVEQALKLMDERQEATVSEGGRVWARLTTRLGLRDRDGERAPDVLKRTWRGHATAVRAVFERVLGPVGAPPPWGAP
jgi:glutamate-ammonia-ligase adenylyltransferase